MLCQIDIDIFFVMRKIVVFALLVAVALSTGIYVSYVVTVHNLGIDFTPSNELEYVHLLKIMLGRHD